MNIPYIEFLFRPLRSELPDHDNLDAYIDEIIPQIAPYSEDLYEEEYYTEKLWREVSDKDSNLSVVVHILKKKDSEHDLFNAASGADYMVSIDGDITKGNWTRPDGTGSNIITLKIANKYELYEKSSSTTIFFSSKNTAINGKMADAKNTSSWAKSRTSKAWNGAKWWSFCTMCIAIVFNLF